MFWDQIIVSLGALCQALTGFRRGASEFLPAFKVKEEAGSEPASPGLALAELALPWPVLPGLALPRPTLPGLSLPELALPGLSLSRFVLLASMLSFALVALPAQCKMTESDERSLALVKKLAASPQLISYDYLVIALGNPGHLSVLPSGLARQAEWFDEGTTRLCYRLQQDVGPLVQAGHVQNKFDFFLKDEAKIDLKELSKQLNLPCVAHFNDRGHQAGVFKLSPNMTLEACQPYHNRPISDINLTYDGPSLSPPSAGEMVEALKLRRAEALDHHAHGHHAQAAPLLAAYLQHSPNDAEAHLRLADSYKARGCLNLAIQHYALAYSLSAADPSIQQTALQKLQALKVAPVSGTVTTTAPAIPAAVAVQPESDPFSVNEEIVDWNRVPLRPAIAATGKVLDAGF